MGVAVSGALIFGPRLIGGIGATATMDFQTTVDGRSVTVRGTTDLPDGAVVGIQLIQEDEWERESADGVAPDPASSPWVITQYVQVQDGQFTATFHPDAWPAGRGGVGAYFWVDANQPSQVIQRFGANGSGLRGPDVTDLDDRGPTLEVERTFEIPN